MKLIIIRGSGASGKSSLAHKISADLNINAFYKDGYKEKQFDALGRLPNPKEMYSFEQDS